MRRLALLLITLCLALPSWAADAARPDRKQVFGDVTVYYNAFASGALTPEVAQASGIERSKRLGVLNITLLKGGTPTTAVVSGKVKDLTGRASALSFRQVSSAGAVSYIAQFKTEQAQTLVFDVQIEAGGISHDLQFNQDVFPGE
ncbi:DUF4426 domain-containing protein [Pseudomonas sp. K1(2024)]|uniref:DUF4426 domain-containing protein n=2 Tax=Pseudomonas TaxID=286 RepID=A0AAI8P9Q7_9PSED|nr:MULTISPECIES: DUF4426 domain-containing protein [Pseudomonas]AIZ35135.1 homoserine acetyltransferase [Pseudomonas parafulva]AXO86595.1 DUF4426 domain-containing protein [Pseudomonas parafulva]MDO7903614.1 DUF4426 domain-containing protein [Pseudomonas sp. K13]